MPARDSATATGAQRRAPVATRSADPGSTPAWPRPAATATCPSNQACSRCPSTATMRQRIQQRGRAHSYPRAARPRRRQPGMPGLAGTDSQLPLDVLRPEHSAAGRGTDHPEPDFRATLQCMRKHRQRLSQYRQADDGHRVAGQHEGISPGTAQQGRSGGTQTHPERQHQQK